MTLDNNVVNFPPIPAPPPVMKQFKHIMLDIETLATSQDAVVISVGAVAFDPESEDLGETFYVELSDDLESQQKNGRTINEDTVRWWMTQSLDARRIFAKKGEDEQVFGEIDVSCRHTTLQFMQMFRDFVERNGANKAQIWGNGSDFDNVIIGSLYEDFGVTKPWSYGKNRCYRTMKRMFGEDVPIVRFGVHHNGLDDAITQAKHLQEIVKCLKQPL